MRPETFSRKMEEAFDTYLVGLTVTNFKPLLREMKRVLKKQMKIENDYRSGEETYGYDGEDSIRANMLYISDRWRCAFRLRWLIYGIEQGLIT